MTEQEINDLIQKGIDHAVDSFHVFFDTGIDAAVQRACQEHWPKVIADTVQRDVASAKTEIRQSLQNEENSKIATMISKDTKGVLFDGYFKFFVSTVRKDATTPISATDLVTALELTKHAIQMREDHLAG